MKCLLSNFSSLLIIILPSGWPMELDVALKLAVKGSSAQRGEKAAVGSVSYFNFLASDFLLGVLFSSERLRSVCTWSGFFFSVQHCKLFLSCAESSDIGLPILCCQTGGHIVLHWPWIIITAKKQILSIGCKCSCVCSLYI